MILSCRGRCVKPPRLRLEAFACGPPAGGGMQGRRSLQPISEGFLLVLPKETPQTPKAANGRWQLRCAPHCWKPFGRPGTAHCLLIAAWLRFARAADGSIICKVVPRPQGATHGRPSCAWMQRSAPHQRIASVSEARSASASRRSLALGKTKERGWQGPLAGASPQRAQRKYPRPLAACLAQVSG